MHTPSSSAQDMNVQHLSFKNDPETIRAIAAAYEELEAKHAQMQQDQTAAMYQILRRK